MRGRPEPPSAVPAPPRRADAVAAIFLGAAILASWTAIDPTSLDSFDAPKVILAATALALAAAAALGGRVLRAGAARPRISLPGWLFVAGLAGAALSSMASGRRGSSLAALRLVLLFLLALPLGASEGYRRHRGRLVAVLGGAAFLNAALVVLTALGLWSPLLVYGYSDRAGLGALVGNAGYAGIALALAALTLLPFLLRDGRPRPFPVAAWVACVAGLLVTRSLSAVAVVAGGTALYALLAGGRRGRVALVSGAALLAAAAFLYAPMRARLTGVARAVERGQWNAAFTARAAPWLAAGEMIRAHPLAGVGIGNFGAEYVPARVAAETRFRRRLVLPGMPTNSFAQAHNDYLDLLAGAGIPAGLCIVAAAAILLADLVRRGRRDREAAAAAALLGGSAIAAFAWFPFQIVPTALWILLEAGRAERLRSERAAETTGRAGGRRAAAAAAALAIAGAGIVAAAPEWRKGAALRRLREGEALVLAAARTADPARRSAMLRDAEEVLGEAQPALPADARPWYLLGSASLLRGDGAEALERYGRSLAIEERPETDLNLSRAYVATGNAPAAAADAVRAVWLAPNLLRDLPEDARLPVEQHIRRLTRALGRGRGKPPELWKG